MTKVIDRESLERLVDSGAAFVLFEALGPRQFEDGHIPGARRIDHEDVRAAARAVAPDLATKIVVYCASETCRNSHVAAAALTRLGYTDVNVYAGGKADWLAAGRPLESSRPAA